MLRDGRGAAAVEFAIVMPLLFLLMFGIIEWSLLMYNKAMITNASREGARAGIVFVWDPVNDVYAPPTATDISNVVDGYLADNLISFSAATETVQVTFVDTNSSGVLDSGDYRTVTVTYPYSFLVFPSLIGMFGGSTPATKNLTAATTMRME